MARLSLRIQPLQFDTGVRGGALPVDAHLGLMSSDLPCGDLALRQVLMSDPPVETLLLQARVQRSLRASGAQQHTATSMVQPVARRLPGSPTSAPMRRLYQVQAAAAPKASLSPPCWAQPASQFPALHDQTHPYEAHKDTAPLASRQPGLLGHGEPTGGEHGRGGRQDGAVTGAGPAQAGDAEPWKHRLRQASFAHPRPQRSRQAPGGWLPRDGEA